MFTPRLGVSLHTVTTEITEEAIAGISRSGIRTLEIPPRLFEGNDSREKVAMVKAMCAEGDIRAATVHVPFGGAHDISALDEAARQQAVADMAVSTDLGRQLGACMFVVHASAEPIEEVDRPQRLDQARKSLQEISADCAVMGEKVAVELLPRTCLGNSAEELVALLDGLAPEVCGVCLDTNHLMNRYVALPDVVRRIGGSLFALHLSDYDGVDEKHQLPGRGVVDWAAFLAALGEIDYCGPFNYECKLDGETVEERIRCLHANFEWLSGLL